MLTKLYKVEMRAMGRTLLPLFGVGLIATAVSKLMFIISELLFPTSATNPSHVLTIISTVLMVLVFVFLFSLLLVTFAVAVQRFYNNLLGDEGYLMFTLPATPAQHMGAKLLAALSFEISSFLLAVFCSMLFVGPPRIEVSGIFMSALQTFVLYFVLILFLITMLASMFLMMYTSMAIGSRRPQQRLMASVGAFIVIYLILQALAVASTVTIAIVGSSILENPALTLWIEELATPATFPYLLALMIAGMTAISAIGCAIYWFVTKRILTKNLNLA